MIILYINGTNCQIVNNFTYPEDHQAIKEHVAKGDQTLLISASLIDLVCPIVILFEFDQRNIIGFHDVYGSLFDDLGFNNIFAGGVVRNKSVSRVLKDTVIARIANPSSKRSSVSMLEEEFGVNIDLLIQPHNTYQSNQQPQH